MSTNKPAALRCRSARRHRCERPVTLELNSELDVNSNNGFDRNNLAYKEHSRSPVLVCAAESVDVC